MTRAKRMLADLFPRLPARALRSVLGGVGLARPPQVPWLVNWDLTYACPLRCEHCYSESGRRASRQLPVEDLLRIADVLLALRPIPQIVFTGGEPIVAKGFLQLAEHLAGRGAELALYTSGWKLGAELARRSVPLFARIGVSIDGDTAAVNDVVRGRQGAFDEAILALGRLDAAIVERRAPTRLGIECGVVRSNLHHLGGLCRDVAPRFGALGFIHFGAIIPTGLASEADYAARELLRPAEVEELLAMTPMLKHAAPKRVSVRVIDNAGFQMRRDQVGRGEATDHLVKIEADGRMRGMDIYEGTVGNVLEEPFDRLWRRAVDRHMDPFVVSELGRSKDFQSWASATRSIDRHFASPDDLIRLDARRAR